MTTLDPFERIEEKVDRIDDLLRGRDGQPGVVGRLSRLEEADRRRTWWAKTTAGAAVAAMLAAVMSWLRGHG